jgi:hypothetical protein
MSIPIIVIIVLAVCSVGMKLHRGTSFMWCSKKESGKAQFSERDERGAEDANR